MKPLKFAISFIILFCTIFILKLRIASLPPQGDFLNPITGFWCNAESKHILAKTKLLEKNISEEIVVKYDSNLVPHIFADNDYDLYFAQGYVTARARLWQMDWLVRVAEGRLSEIIKGSERHDIFYRRIGVKYAAERAIDIALSDSTTRMMLQAYSDGVNAYIKKLTPAEYPLEFKLLDYRPEEWRPVNSLLILKMIGEILTGGESEFPMTDALLRFGQDTVNELYRQIPDKFPVIPSNTRWDFLHDSGKNRRSEGRVLAGTSLLTSHNKMAIGSNNWVVGGKKSIGGYPLLANDPHLGISLPSIWYQLQLVSRGLNVEGVSIPGIPCIIIGYNKNIAWGQTNSEIDVVDWYHIQFKDSLNDEYWYDQRWNRVERRIESFKLRNGARIYDTILFTTHGPVVYDGYSHQIEHFIKKLSRSEGFAMRWSLHEPSNDLKGFYLLNRSRDYEEYRNALTFLNCPAQNFVFAGNDGNIAITTAGKIPIRNKENGQFVLEGSNIRNSWLKWIPDYQTPAVKNPVSNFVSSANQSLTDSTYPYFIAGHFANPSRAIRINERLVAMNAATVDSMRMLQNDSYSEIAGNVLPALLKRLNAKSYEMARKEISEVTNWDFNFRANSKGASIFQEWWNQLYYQIWEDDMGHGAFRLPWPDDAKTVRIILVDTNSHWIDNSRIATKGTITSLVNASFLKCIEILKTKYGLIGPRWEWGNVRATIIHHLAGVDAFSNIISDADGAVNTVNALSDNSGPSWRMVVELGPIVKGYGVFPGGESGNPGSFFYDNSIRTWQKGELNDLVFLKDKNENGKNIISTLTIKNKN